MFEDMWLGAVRKPRAEELKDLQGHDVFEVVWLGEVGLSGRCDASGCKT